MAKFGDFPTQDEMPAGGGVVGLAGSHQLTTVQSGGGGTFLDDLTVTVTVVATKAYRVHWVTRWALATGTDTRNVSLRVDSVDVALIGMLTGSAPGNTCGCALYVPGTSGSKVFNIQYQVAAGSSALTLYGAATNPRQLWVERVSP